MPTNKTAIALITTTICVLAFTGVSTICVLAYLGIEIPPELNTLAGGLVGSVGTLLAKTSPTETTSAKGNGPTDVNVINPESDPANVAEVPKP